MASSSLAKLKKVITLEHEQVFPNSGVRIKAMRLPNNPRFYRGDFGMRSGNRNHLTHGRRRKAGLFRHG
jgi:hypothetical protein